jgi:hypothetical protein
MLPCLREVGKRAAWGGCRSQKLDHRSCADIMETTITLDL